MIVQIVHCRYKNSALKVQTTAESKKKKIIFEICYNNEILASHSCIHVYQYQFAVYNKNSEGKAVEIEKSDL